MNKNTLWYPYTQIKTMAPPLKISKAKGAYLYLDEENTKLLDAISSWWCVIHGYNHPKLNKAIKIQLKKMAHVMLGGLTHEPIEKLSKKLVEITPKGLNHVFFSDSGSVGCEIALKLAFQYFKNQGILTKTKFISLKNAYHGDTTGVMGLADDDEGIHHLYKEFITFSEKTEAENITQLEIILKEKHSQIAGFFIEPLMQGAGGFKLNTPYYLEEAYKLCKKYNVLYIADEVATGFGRTGNYFAMDETTCCPDIMILGKGLTGGYLGMAATLTTSKLFESFYSTDPLKAFMHGPTFMGNPLAAAVALESIHLIETENSLKKVKEIESIFKQEFCNFKHKKVKEVRIKGAMVCLEVHSENDLKKASQKAKEKGVFLRPFSKYLYSMPPYCITKKEAKKISNTLKYCLEE